MKKSYRALIFIVPGVAAVALAVGLTVLKTPSAPDAPPPDDKGKSTLATPANQAELAEIPADLRQLPIEASDAVKRLAKGWPADPAGPDGFAKELAALPEREIPGDTGAEAPHTAREIAEALEAKRPLAIASFERAIVTIAVLKARGQDANLGAVAGAKFSASEILARRFVVRVGSGPWFALDTLPLDQGQVVPMNEVDVAANMLAFRVLSAIARGDMDGASKLAGFARRLRPNDAAILFTAGRAEVAGGLGDIGETTMGQAAALTSDAMTHYLLGLAARQSQRPFKADAAFHKAAELDPTFGEAWVQLAELALSRMDLTPKKDQPALIQSAREAIEGAKKANPNTFGIRLISAHIAGLEEHYPEAATLLEEETKLHPRAPQAYVALAEVLAAQEKSAEAIKALETARLQGLDTAEVLTTLGALYAMNERLADAVPVLEKALTLNPESRDLRPQLAQLERQAGKGAEAKRLLVEHVARFPDDLSVALLLAQLQLEQGDLPGARAAIAKVLEKNPDHKEGRILDYLVRLVANDPSDEARAKAMAAVGGRKKLAELLLSQGFDKEGEVMLLEQLKADPDELGSPVLLAALYTARGREAEALKLRDETLARVPEAERGELTKMFEQALQAPKSKQP